MLSLKPLSPLVASSKTRAYTICSRLLEKKITNIGGIWECTYPLVDIAVFKDDAQHGVLWAFKRAFLCIYQ